MSLDKLLQDTVREQVALAIGPLASIVAELQAQGAIVARLASALGTPVPRRVGRPAKIDLALPMPAAKLVDRKGKRAKAVVAASEEGGPQNCALEDCGRPARSKGYCAAHYQKFRMLQKTGRLPSDWVEFAAEGSVQNITLPRGRAGAKALADAKRKGKD
jgi:hypothetical protein